jgi:hypothetical protein
MNKLENWLRIALLIGGIVYVYGSLGYMALETYARVQCLKWNVPQAVIGEWFESYCVVTAAGTEIPLPLSNMEFFARNTRQ